ncbi:hypothetical protein H6504_00105 [Candidatus Woesearchaeota archaeon]|nr:hypothetical protein [Candidatus Woesearchaeota archaeon]
MKRGRPAFSQVRLNMVELLDAMGSAYGYEIARAYLDLFPKVSMRLFYYHLKKGVELGEFRVDKVKKAQGDYSWGTDVERIYYTLGDHAQPQGVERVRDYVKRLQHDKN